MRCEVLGNLGCKIKLVNLGKKGMDKRYYSLEVNKSNKLTRSFQLIFGIVCVIVALVWLVLNFKSLGSSGTLWITIIFLIGFGYYQIISGLGKAEKFIEIDKDSIRLKRNSFLPPAVLNADEIEKIEIFTLNLIFFMRQNRTTILRFGTTYTENVEPIKDSIKKFATANSIGLDEKIEEF